MTPACVLLGFLAALMLISKSSASPVAQERELQVNTIYYYVIGLQFRLIKNDRTIFLVIFYDHCKTAVLRKE